ncbi:uncharacterized protein LOC125760039 isoform X2 [Rhipicephalus sanguineus]|uniref:uncharacterized protein LOC119378331 isoform X2 n=1 Tax=Rhipicephalus sanguineus TaxID=34632 RepID=UPI0020C1C587|nr:uncharacterized protein LOC119378331 isoform X2 [Rhipicephalus sanguineus]XP_049275587.1 uncharacterized protein LOC125760039 isoform X2 [Rhipicephalus sanguineus]
MPLPKKPRGCRFRRPLASASGNIGLLQVFVLLFAPLLRLGFLGNHPFLDYCQSASVTIQSLAWNASSQETPRMPFPSAARFCVWQHRATTSEGRQHRLQIAAPDSSALGHATATTVVTKMPFLMQVSYLPNAACVRSGNRCLLAVSCPTCVIGTCRLLCEMLWSLCNNAQAVNMLLLMSGDVELNPGPVSPPSMETIANAISRIEASQTSVLTELSLIRTSQSSIEALVTTLSTRVDTLEKIVQSTQSNETGLKADVKDSFAKLSAEIRVLTDKCDDAENRLRRSNLLFCGIPDTKGESWIQSQAKVIKFCSENLGISIPEDDLERAHRLGRYQQNKSRPIIVKYARFKDKSKILAVASKLKGTTFSIREDYSARVRQARRKLYDHGMLSGKPFKLRFDKLLLENKQFSYHAESDSVVELQS